MKQNRWIYHSLFILIVLGVIAYKFNDLFLPYFWDELGVYSQAAYYQYTHGLSLMPSSVPVLFSRGHPLLFTFCNAFILKISGPSVVCVHLFNLFVAISLLAVLYASVSKYFGPTAAIISCAFMACQPVFLAQSCLMLPEIMLALFAFSALLFLYEEKYWGFALFSSLAILTKETAIILPAVAVIYLLIRFVFSRKASGAFNPANVLLLISPSLVFGAFLLIQKRQNGWYLFPYHIENLFTSLSGYWSNSERFLQFLFWDQGREFWLFTGTATLIFAIYKNGFRIGFLALLLVLFIIVFILFSSLNFYMERYLILALIPLSVIIGCLLSQAVKNKFLAMLCTGLLCTDSLFYLQTDTFNYDADMGYIKEVRTLQKAVDYTCTIANNKVVYANFPGYFAINFAEGGYLKGRKINATKELNGTIDYFIFSNPSPGSPPDTAKFKADTLKTFKDGYAEETIYRLEKK